jgi:purine-binding chemotaxis protein CheW
MADTQSFTALTFAMGGEVFAIDANSVREIMDVIPVAEVPGAPEFAAGLINVRGRVVPLADLRLRFGMERVADTIDTRFMVVEVDLAGQPTIVGLRADKVYEVTDIARAAIEEAPQIGMKWRSDFIKGIGKRGDDFIVIPDIERTIGAN